VCKLRISNHKLKIKVGRFSKIPGDEKICASGNMSIGAGSRRSLYVLYLKKY
jgi:hypothetical protein